MLHDIQKKILLSLAAKPGQKYSGLRIEGIENDLFNYHLQYLVKNNLVVKKDELYFITNQGVDSILLLDSTGKQYSGIRASVLVYVINRSSKKDYVLIQKRIRKPYLGEINPGISGKIMTGESVKNAAVRKLKEETGLEGQCNFVGAIRKTRISKDNNIDDAFFYVCVCEKWKGSLREKTEYGENSWVSVQEAIKLQRSLKSSGKRSLDVLVKILNGNYELFFHEEVININEF